MEVELWNRPGKRWPGTIREIAPAADAQARTYATRVSLAAEALDAVELGQSARVYVAHAKGCALNVPLAAVQPGRTQQEAGVWVVDPGKGTLHLREVTLGAYGAQSVPVLSGLKADDWVVAAGGHLLREGQPVTAVDRGNKPVMQAAAKQGD